MVRITCDTCAAVKPSNDKTRREEWILGYDLETQSPRSLRRSVQFLDRWDDRRINELGAIHFCCVECKVSTCANRLRPEAVVALGSELFLRLVSALGNGSRCQRVSIGDLDQFRNLSY